MLIVCTSMNSGPKQFVKQYVVSCQTCPASYIYLEKNIRRTNLFAVKMVLHKWWSLENEMLPPPP